MSAIAHVGVAVVDLDGALGWYRDVLGFDLLGPPTEVRAGEGHAGTVAADVFGPGFGSFRQAHLAGANGAALELFEFSDPPVEPGLFHLCVVARDVEGTAQRIVAAGGRRLTRAWPIFAGEPCVTCHLRDPWGVHLELYSHGHERTYSNRGSG
jgi:catechol 2,3-dioxygenase-like lactoylglutathione lyase family enzyme